MHMLKKFCIQILLKERTESRGDLGPGEVGKRQEQVSSPLEAEQLRRFPSHLQRSGENLAKSLDWRHHQLREKERREGGVTVPSPEKTSTMGSGSTVPPHAFRSHGVGPLPSASQTAVKGPAWSSRGGARRAWMPRARTSRRFVASASSSAFDASG
jgi:hypothetical protein